jgi:ribosomal protein L18
MRILAAIMALSVCAGCTGPEPENGNIAGVNSTALVQDTVFAMLRNYPPAHTRLAFVQKTDDGFGAQLIEALRGHGYAVAEYVEPEITMWGTKEAAKPDGLPFAYLIAGTGVENEIRVTVHVGGESLSRLYEVARGEEEVNYLPLGFWSRREQGNRVPEEDAQATGDS